jgi:O-antigen/teichoic acid export membrane protein
MFIKNLIYNGIGTFGVKFSGFILGIFVARELGQENFGIYSAVISAFVLFGNTFVNVTSQYISSYQVTSNKGDFNLRKLKNIALPTISIYLFFLLIISYFLNQAVYWLDTFICLTVISLTSLSQGLLFLRAEHKTYAKIALFSSLLFFLTLAFTYFFKLLTIRLAMYIYSLPYLAITLLYIYTFKKESYASTFTLKECFSFFKNNMLLFTSACLVPLSFWITYNLFSSKINFATIGLFSSILQWSWIISQIAIVVSNVLISKLKNEKENLLANDMNLVFSWLPSTLAICFIMSFYEIHYFVFGNDFKSKETSLLFAIIFSTLFLSAFKSSIYRNIIIKGLSHLSFASNFLWLCLFVFLLYFFEELDILKIALIYSSSNFLIFILFFPIYLKYDLFSVNSKSTILSTIIIISYFLCTVCATVFIVNFQYRLILYLSFTTLFVLLFALNYKKIIKERLF